MAFCDYPVNMRRSQYLLNQQRRPRISNRFLHLLQHSFPNSWDSESYLGRVNWFVRVWIVCWDFHRKCHSLPSRIRQLYGSCHSWICSVTHKRRNIELFVSFDTIFSVQFEASITMSNIMGRIFRMWSLTFSPSASVPIAKSCSTRHKLSTVPWYTFIQSSANCKCVEYFESSFWYCGIFLIITDKSRNDCLSLWLIRLDSVKRLRFCVTRLETTAMCWCRNSSHSSSLSSSKTSLSFAFGIGMYLKVCENAWLIDFGSWSGQVPSLIESSLRTYL